MIDDDKADREAIRKYLKKIDSVSVSIYEADGVEVGLKQMDDHDIDVCLLDFRLHPSGDNDFTLRAKQREYSVPIIVMSGLSRDDLEGQLPAQDVVMFIPKGEMSPLVLELSIKHALGSSAALLPQ